MKKSTSSLNAKKKILVKAVLFSCAILCPALMFNNGADAMFSSSEDFDPLDSFYEKNYSTEATGPSALLNNKKPNLYVYNNSVEEIFPKDPFNKFWNMKSEAPRNIEEDIAEEVEEQMKQYNGDYPGYKKECEDIISQYYKDRESTVIRYTSDFTPPSTKEGMENYRQSIEQLSAELNELKQKCQNDLSSLGTRAYEHDFHNLDLIKI